MAGAICSVWILNTFPKTIFTFFFKPPPSVFAECSFNFMLPFIASSRWSVFPTVFSGTSAPFCKWFLLIPEICGLLHFAMGRISETQYLGFLLRCFQCSGSDSSLTPLILAWFPEQKHVIMYPETPFVLGEWRIIVNNHYLSRTMIHIVCCCGDLKNLGDHKADMILAWGSILTSNILSITAENWTLLSISLFNRWNINAYDSGLVLMMLLRWTLFWI